jgi:uncharacterized membrane protein HdeD (DUF308 family)
MRIAACTLGLAPVVLGVVLLFNPVKATNALALLLGIALVFGGLLELAVGWESRPRWGSVVVAGILVVGGLLAMVWPVSRCGRSPSSPGCPWWRTASAGSSSRWPRGTRPRGWPWLLLAGAFGVFSGVLALVWPAATVLVPSIVLGAQVAVFGLLLMAVAFLPLGSPSGTSSQVPAGA